MNEEQATRLLERLGDQVPVGPPPTSAVVGLGRRRRRRHRALAVVATSAAVVVAVIAPGVIHLRSEQDLAVPLADGTSAGPTTPAPTTPPGTRLVGLGSVAVSVPSGWATNDVGCGGPRSDTVVFDLDGLTETQSCLLPVPPDVQWLDLYTADPRDIETFLGDDAQAVDVDGAAALREPTDCDLSNGYRHCSAALGLPDLGVLMVAHGTDHSVVDDILDSAQLLREGYVSAPSLVGLADTKAAGLVAAAGLTMSEPCQHQGCDDTIASQSPEAGTVVSAGSDVEVVPYLRGNFVIKSVLLGVWHPIELRGEDVSDVRRIGGSPVNVVFSDFGKAISWYGYDGCNWSSGPVRLGSNGRFDAVLRATTTRGCVGRAQTQTTENVPVLDEATHARILYDKLYLYDDSANLLGIYEYDGPFPPN